MKLKPYLISSLTFLTIGTPPTPQPLIQPSNPHYSGYYTHPHNCFTSYTGGTQWHRWLRHCATSWKVTGSIPDGINGIFH
jgi:hypothetical protein